MQTLDIVNLIDNAETEQELQDALAVVMQDLTAQVLAVQSAVRDNPYVGRVTLEELVKSLGAAVQSEYLSPGSVLD